MDYFGSKRLWLLGISWHCSSRRFPAPWLRSDCWGRRAARTGGRTPPPGRCSSPAPCPSP
ncbi:hypothetical protein HW555_004152 [Spodoptera exigua]|uniref:Uncharacterized protein n=1 Tax=Spodoptera exigua TaxID=7107 RepID=A0A835GIT7_SPOEX|nr:hypothetical protein HW555_004152 [Spodoptera exigua]